MRWTRSLRFRLTAAMLLVFGLGAANVVVYLLNIDEDLRSHIMNKQVDTILASFGVTPLSADLAVLPTRFSEADWRYSLYDHRRLLSSSPAAAEPLAYLDADEERIDGHSAQVSRQMPDGKVLVIAKNDSLERGELRELIRQELAGSSVLILILAAISFVATIALATWTLKSVNRAAVLAGTIGSENLDRRIPLEELPTEIQPLAAAANEALDNLANAYASERRFTADAAHELRTPLAVLSLRLQRAKLDNRLDWDSLDREMGQMRRLIDQLMTLAQADRAAVAVPGSAIVPVSRIVRFAVADMMVLFEQKGRMIEADIEDGLCCAGDEGQLRQAVQNLLDNGLAHGSGTVVVRVNATADSRIVIEVGDEGPPPNPEQRETWFQRFHKERQNTPGSGLGLSIVSRIAEIMGGNATFVSGANFAIRITLPRVL